MSDSQDRKLFWWERWALRGHLIACRVCPELKRQLDWITRSAETCRHPDLPLDDAASNDLATPQRAATPKRAAATPRVDAPMLDEQRRQRIKQAIREASS